MVIPVKCVQPDEQQEETFMNNNNLLLYINLYDFLIVYLVEYLVADFRHFACCIASKHRKIENVIA